MAGTNEEVGTPVSGLIKALEQEGFTVDAAEERILNDVRDALGRKELVVVNSTEPVLEWGHYAIVEKFEGDTLILIDPDSRTGKTSMGIEEFERRWKDPLFTKANRWAAFVTAAK